MASDYKKIRFQQFRIILLTSRETPKKSIFQKVFPDHLKVFLRYSKVLPSYFKPWTPRFYVKMKTYKIQKYTYTTSIQIYNKYTNIQQVYKYTTIIQI